MTCAGSAGAERGFCEPHEGYEQQVQTSQHAKHIVHTQGHGLIGDETVHVLEGARARDSLRAQLILVRSPGSAELLMCSDNTA